MELGIGPDMGENVPESEGARARVPTGDDQGELAPVPPAQFFFLFRLFLSPRRARAENDEAERDHAAPKLTEKIFLQVSPRRKGEE